MNSVLITAFFSELLVIVKETSSKLDTIFSDFYKELEKIQYEEKELSLSIEELESVEKMICGELHILNKCLTNIVNTVNTFKNKLD